MVLKLVSTKEEIPGVTSFIWKKPQKLTFYPGQYFDYQLKINDPLGNTRAFTISASPTEDFLMLTTRQGYSIFKKKLFIFKPGDTIEISHPVGTFILDETEPAVFIAGGIGITPARSMIKYAFDQKLRTLINLIYSNSDENFVFEKELKTWQKSLPNLTISWINTKKDGLLDKNKLKQIVNQSLPNTIYYLAGPPKMVDDFAKILQSLGVDETNIRYDHFDGY